MGGLSSVPKGCRFPNPSLGTYRRQAVNISLPHTKIFFLSKMYPQVRTKKKKWLKKKNVNRCHFYNFITISERSNIECFPKTLKNILLR